MIIKRSTAHAKISGNFGEALVLYWLSKYGFECVSVDHTGIDIIAKRLDPPELMGISVKCRTRPEGKEKDSIAVGKDEPEKVDEACATFECRPYYAIVVDAGSTIKAFIMAKSTFEYFAPNCNFNMTPDWLARYEASEQIMSFEMETKTTRWWAQESRIEVLPGSGNGP
jgi:hypothetical protein